MSFITLKSLDFDQRFRKPPESEVDTRSCERECQLDFRTQPFLSSRPCFVVHHVGCIQPQRELSPSHPIDMGWVCVSAGYDSGGR